MTYGFVYIAKNKSMPDLFKVGFTERSPFLRARELSSSTSAPTPFSLLCYGEFAKADQVERDMHQWLSEHRVNRDREFFRIEGVSFAIRLLYWHPNALMYATCQERTKDGWGCPEAEDYCLNFSDGIWGMDDTKNPFQSIEAHQRKMSMRQSMRMKFDEEIVREDEFGEHY